MKESYAQLIDVLLSLENFDAKTKAKARRKIGEIAPLCETETDLYRWATAIIMRLPKSNDALATFKPFDLRDNSSLREVIGSSELPKELDEGTLLDDLELSEEPGKQIEDDHSEDPDFPEIAVMPNECDQTDNLEVSWQEFWAMYENEFTSQQLDFFKKLAGNNLIRSFFPPEVRFNPEVIKNRLAVLAGKSSDGNIVMPIIHLNNLAGVSFSDPEIFTFKRGALSYTQILRIYEAQKQRKKLQDVAELVGCSRITVRKYYKSLGLKAEIGKPPLIPQEKQEQLVQLISSGVSIIRSTQILGISRNTTRKYCRKFGLESHPLLSGGKPPIPDEKVREIIRLNKSGFSCLQIAEILGVSSASIYKYHEKLNLKPSRRKICQVAPEKIAQIRVLKQQGLSISKIARTVGAGRAAVRRHLTDSETVYEFRERLNSEPKQKRLSQFPSEKINQIHSLHEQGVSINKIAIAVGTSRVTVRRYIAKRKNNKSPE